MKRLMLLAVVLPVAAVAAEGPAGSAMLRLFNREISTFRAPYFG